ncbi:tail protein [Shigella phage vB_SflM_004]|nr:tail protein [Shigella phage vB_SflM_004]
MWVKLFLQHCYSNCECTACDYTATNQEITEGDTLTLSIVATGATGHKPDKNDLELYACNACNTCISIFQGSY